MNDFAISIGIVDDHLLFTESLSLLLDSFDNFKVFVSVNNGLNLQQK